MWERDAPRHKDGAVSHDNRGDSTIVPSTHTKQHVFMLSFLAKRLTTAFGTPLSSRQLPTILAMVFFRHVA